MGAPITSSPGTADAEIGLSGKGMQQSAEQWAERSRVLAEAMAELVADNQPRGAATGLDVGCQGGGLIDALSAHTGLLWQGIDPGITEERQSPNGSRLIHGWADQLDFADESFDVVLLANVYEHIVPEKRVASFEEMARVLKPGGILVGQIPNPYFLIESHSRLPFMGMLPVWLQKRYWKMAPVPWEHDFYSVTMADLQPDARAADLRMRYSRHFNYPVTIYPTSVQPVVRVLQPVMRRWPWAFQFVLVKP